MERGISLRIICFPVKALFVIFTELLQIKNVQVMFSRGTRITAEAGGILSHV
jgi:hypothetical protein